MCSYGNGTHGCEMALKISNLAIGEADAKLPITRVHISPMSAQTPSVQPIVARCCFRPEADRLTDLSRSRRKDNVTWLYAVNFDAFHATKAYHFAGKNSVG